MTNIFIDSLSQQAEMSTLTSEVKSSEVLETTEAPESKNGPIPSNIYPRFTNEDKITEAINENFNIFQINSLINTVKSNINPLHISLEKKSKVFIFGAGGTTSWFLPKLLKIYNDAFNKVPTLRYDLQIVLIDLDQVEPKNLIRQNFISDDVNRNKAEVLSERYNDLYPNISVTYVAKYATYSNFDSKFLPENKYGEEHFVCLNKLGINKEDILINLVDNEGFKKKLDFYIARYKNPLFAAGVNLFNGQVYYSINKHTNGYVYDHPDLLGIFDEVSVHACADHDANGTDDNPEQLFNGNDVAASLLANLYQTVLTSIPLYKRINFVSGDNMHVSIGARNYSVLYHYVKTYLKDNSESINKAQGYFSRYGYLTTKSALRHAKVLRDNHVILNFKSIYEGQGPIPPIELPEPPKDGSETVTETTQETVSQTA